MGHFHGHSDHALQPSYHHLALGVARHSWPQDFIRGRLASLLRLRVTGVKTLSFFPVWILGSGRPLKTIRLPGTSRSSTLMSPSIGLGGASGFHTRDSRTHPSSRHFAPRRRSLRSLA